MMMNMMKTINKRTEMVKELKDVIELLPSSALAPASDWAELVLFPLNPGRPSGIVLSSANTAWRSKV